MPPKKKTKAAPKPLELVVGPIEELKNNAGSKVKLSLKPNKKLVTVHIKTSQLKLAQTNINTRKLGVLERKGENKICSLCLKIFAKISIFQMLLCG